MFAVPSHQAKPTSIDTNSPAPFYHANLLNSSQLPHDGPSPGSQLPTDLDGSSHHNPSSKDKEAIPTFSRVVKLEMGGLGGLILFLSLRIPNSHRKCGILPTPSHFTAPKVNTVPPPITPPTVVVSDNFCARGDMGMTSGTTLEPTPLPTTSWQARKSQVPPVVSDLETDLPLDDED
ncbi:hypothetical protein Cgig2_017530 [Carnegiea gigantea]|uniref:Uncharacterized protein n=1 Tax=Carnegiea gigantea TaxID=171969 RepID=A0A9Q1JLZ6_9CARY|nr:hypothetical protein Cgig2_017530 [Carnegiea gigantea]